MKTQFRFYFVLLALLAGLQQAAAQGTAFTYQGQLNAGGAPATGSYDFVFALYDNLQSGNQIGPAVTNSAVGVTNGLFTTTLDFGGGPFTGSNCWLGISVRTNATGAFTGLAPRQPVTPAPYAIYSAHAGNAATADSANSVAAANIAGIVPLAQLPAGVLTNPVSFNSSQFASSGAATNIVQAGVTNNAVGFTNATGTETWIDVVTQLGCDPTGTIPVDAAIANSIQSTLGGNRTNFANTVTYYFRQGAYRWTNGIQLPLTRALSSVSFRGLADNAAYFGSGDYSWALLAPTNGTTFILSPSMTNHDFFCNATILSNPSTAYDASLWNYTWPHFYDLHFIDERLAATDASQFRILNFSNINYCTVENCCFDTGCAPEQVRDLPTNCTAIYCPQVNDGDYVIVKNCSFCGMGVGIDFSEHAFLQGNDFNVCAVAYQADRMAHGDNSIIEGQIADCATAIKCVGGLSFFQAFLELEHTGLGDDSVQPWQQGINTIDDPYGYGFATVTYHSTIASGTNQNQNAVITANGAPWFVFYRPGAIGTSPWPADAHNNIIPMPNLPVTGNVSVAYDSGNSGLDQTLGILVTNSSAGGYANLGLFNDSSDELQLALTSSGFSNEAAVARQAVLNAGGPGGIELQAYSTSGAISFVTGGSAATNRSLLIDPAGDIWASNNFAVGGMISGNGGGLTNLNPVNLGAGTANISIAGNAATATTAASANSVSAANIAGALSLAQLPAAVVTNNQNGATLSGTFGGNGSSLDFRPLTNLNLLEIGCYGDSMTAGDGTCAPFGQCYPTELALDLGRMAWNFGIGGETSTEIASRLLADQNDFGTYVIWAGRNDYAQSNTVWMNISNMVNWCQTNGHRYLVLSIVNRYGGTENVGTALYDEITNLNGALAAAYGTNYFDIREWLVQQADLVNYPTAGETNNLLHDVPAYHLLCPSSGPHLNVAGWEAVGDKVAQILSVGFPNNLTVPVTQIPKLIGNNGTGVFPTVDTAPFLFPSVFLGPTAGFYLNQYDQKTLLCTTSLLPNSNGSFDLGGPVDYWNNVWAKTLIAGNNWIGSAADGNLQLASSGGTIYGTNLNLGSETAPFANLFAGMVSAKSLSGSGAGVTNVSANAIVGGLTTNLAVLVPGGGTNTLCFTNGILMSIQ